MSVSYACRDCGEMVRARDWAEHVVRFHPDREDAADYRAEIQWRHDHPAEMEAIMVELAAAGWTELLLDGGPALDAPAVSEVPAPW